jgi:hypothetical protein
MGRRLKHVKEVVVEDAKVDIVMIGGKARDG